MAAAPAAAAELAVEVSNVAADQGRVLVALCTPQTFLGERCPYVAAAEARAGSTIVRLHGVLPGTYAVQAFHDLNNNREIDRNLLGVPIEGIGFGNDAAMRSGPPDFEDAAVVLNQPQATTTLSLRYFSRR